VGKEWHFIYEFRVVDQLVGWSGESLIYDLFSLAKAVEAKAGGKHKPPKTIPYLQLLGLRSVSVADDAAAGELCAPYSESGFFLAPMITGFANVRTLSYQ
jgi:hypothetical protein